MCTYIFIFRMRSRVACVECASEIRAPKTLVFSNIIFLFFIFISRGSRRSTNRGIKRKTDVKSRALQCPPTFFTRVRARPSYWCYLWCAYDIRTRFPTLRSRNTFLCTHVRISTTLHRAHVRTIRTELNANITFMYINITKYRSQHRPLPDPSVFLPRVAFPGFVFLLKRFPERVAASTSEPLVFQTLVTSEHDCPLREIAFAAWGARKNRIVMFVRPSRAAVDHENQWRVIDSRRKQIEITILQQCRTSKLSITYRAQRYDRYGRNRRTHYTDNSIINNRYQ